MKMRWDQWMNSKMKVIWGEMYQNTENMADKYFPEDGDFGYDDYDDYY